MCEPGKLAMFSWGSDTPKRLVKPELRLCPVEASDLSFLLAPDTFWLESLNLLFFGNDGSFLHNGFVVASMPLNKHKVMLNTKYFSPTGHEHHYQNVYKADALEWTNAGTSCDMGGGSSFRYGHDKREYTVRFCFDAAPPPVSGGFGDGGGGGDGEQRFEVALTATADCGQGLRVGDGAVFYDAAKTKFWKNVFYPKMRAEGRVAGRPWSGHAFMSKVTCNVPMHQISSEAHHFKMYSNDGDHALVMVEQAAPKAYGYEKYTLGAYVRRGEIVAVTHDNEVRWLHSAVPDGASGYALPAEYEYIWKGTTIEGGSTHGEDGGEGTVPGQAFEARARLRPARMLSRVDLLAHLPAFIRWVVQRLIAKPYMFLWLEQDGHDTAGVDTATAEVTVKVDGKRETIKGVLLHEKHYINPGTTSQ